MATDGSHQVTALDSTTAIYDVAGNMDDYGGMELHYDHENRLAHIDRTSGHDYWFRYDALGRRVGEGKYGGPGGDPDEERLFFYDGAHIVEETAAVSNPDSDDIERLSLFGVKLDEVIYSGDVDGSGDLTSHRFPLEDHIGSIVAVYDDAGSAQAVFNYDSYGVVTNTPAEKYP